MVFGVAMHDLGAVWKTLNFAEIGTVAFWYHVGASESLSTGINWATIFFIAGICLIVVVQYFALLLRRQISSKTADYKKLEGYPISWRTYCGLLAPATVLVIAMCLIYIYVRYL